MAVKPSSGTAINTASSLYTSLQNAWAMLEGSGTTTADSKGGNTATFTSSPAPTWGSTAEGPQILLGTDQAFLTPATPITLTASASYSIAWAAVKTTASGNQGMILGDTTSGASTWLWEETATDLDISNLGFAGDWTCTTFGTRSDMVLSASWNGSTYDVSVYQNGSLVLLRSSLAVHTALAINALGNGFFSSGYSLIGSLEYIYIWQGRALSSGNASTLATDPYSFFRASVKAGGAPALLCA